MKLHFQMNLIPVIEKRKDVGNILAQTNKTLYFINSDRGQDHSCKYRLNRVAS
jgi:hypothetical protein